ncbi:MAG: hypothetical protein ABSH41_26115, partial [Syntrophobacteraceae bacterium]
MNGRRISVIIASIAIVMMPFVVQAQLLSPDSSTTITDGSLAYDNEWIGWSGTGINFTQAGGSNSTNFLAVGDPYYGIMGYVSQKIVDGSSYGNDTFNLSNSSSTTGTLTSGTELIGNGGTGTFNQTGGNNTVSILNIGTVWNTLYLGVGTSAATSTFFIGNGTYNLSNGSLNVTGTETVGNGGTGTFNQTGGTNTTNSLYVSVVTPYQDQLTGTYTYFSSPGAYNLSGGQLNGGSEYIGYSGGTGVFTQSGGTNTVNGLYISNRTGGNGTYNLSGGQLNAGNEYIGQSGGTGIFTQSGGTNTVSNNLFIGDESGGNGTYNLSGGQVNAGYEYIGFYGGMGTFTQSGGTNTVGVLYIGDDTGGQGTYNLSAGQLNAS